MMLRGMPWHPDVTVTVAREGDSDAIGHQRASTLTDAHRRPNDVLPKQLALVNRRRELERRT